MKSQGQAVYDDRNGLGLSLWEYAILSNIDPNVLDAIERGEFAVDDEDDLVSLRRWGVDLTTSPRGSAVAIAANGDLIPRSSLRRFSLWSDVPFSDHTEARRLIRDRPVGYIEIASKFGIGSEDVRYIEKKALIKVRSGLEREGVDASDIRERGQWVYPSAVYDRT